MDHRDAVQQVATRVADFHRRRQPFRIYHGSTNSTRPSGHAASTTVSTAGLTRVLEVDETRQTALVEPNVPMDALVAATRVHGLVPLVVMEFPGITAGGGFSGTSGESSSFREGFFDNTVNWIEMVLADGQVVKAYHDRVASEFEIQDARSDLFWGAASSFGTLGVVTLLEVRLKNAYPLVELQYYAAADMEAALRIFREAAADPTTEYLDGIIYARDHIVVCAGRQAERTSASQLQHFAGRHDDWFYLHAQRIAPKPLGDQPAPAPVVDYIPLTDYLFRYDRGGFWVGRYAYRYFRVPFTSVTRSLLDRFMHTRVMYHALHVSGLSRRYIIQDVGVPVPAAPEFLDWLDCPENFGQYPIWLCPLPAGSAGGLEGQTINASLHPDQTALMNFGVWGPATTADPSRFRSQNRRLEQKVQDLRGKKWLYAHTYYTEEEFWAIYNKAEHDSLRNKYAAEYLPSLYDKVRVQEADLPGAGSGKFEAGWKGAVKRTLWDVWPCSGLYGAYKAWRGGDYLLQKESPDQGDQSR
ncbi:uncharacterized protein PFLUO_LOCUS8529 [Penicillium psychrofluorescens]|uniref:uncharacterized protein n=1 Tax=Penicillium psychrofluorescens TaxID=3158075 RepID=UPI003CCD5146